jgi:hypothetical protein
MVKSYTSKEQSEMLIKLGIPIETADMEYMFLKKDGSKVSNVPFVKDGFEEPECCYIFTPCWSLAALRACLPPGISIDGILYVFESHNTFDNEWVYEYKFEDISAPLYSKSLNEIDACVNMIIQLKENKMI